MFGKVFMRILFHFAWGFYALTHSITHSLNLSTHFTHLRESESESVRVSVSELVSNDYFSFNFFLKLFYVIRRIETDWSCCVGNYWFSNSVKWKATSPNLPEVQPTRRFVYCGIFERLLFWLSRGGGYGFEGMGT